MRISCVCHIHTILPYGWSQAIEPLQAIDKLFQYVKLKLNIRLTKNMDNIINLKNLREHMQEYARKVRKGDSFIVFKKSKPLFKITPIDSDVWEEVIDFTKIKKQGVDIKNLLERL